MKKKLLIAGGSHADIPIIVAAKELGYWVITSGNNPNDLGHKYSDEYQEEDYSKPKKMLELAKRLKINAICASSNDFSAISCAYVAEQLGLPGYDSVETSLMIHHKDKFRKFAQQYNLSVPKAISVSENSENWQNHELAYPIMVKPVDLSGGKGISKVTNRDELGSAISKAFTLTNSMHVVIEEYIDGSNHGYSTFIKDGKVVFHFMDDEHYFSNPYLVSGASTSLLYTKDIASKLNKDLEVLASELMLVDGLLHVQFILKDNLPYIIEICRRTPGDLYVKLVEFATGFNMSKAIVQSIIKENVDSFEIKKLKFVTRHCVMSKNKGHIKEIKYNDFSPRIFDKMTFFKTGDMIDDISTYKAEIDFIRYNDKEDYINNIDTININITIELTS